MRRAAQAALSLYKQPMRNSRLSYLGAETASGGKAAKPKPAKPRVLATPHPSYNGVPGPEEPLLDIAEVIRTPGMQYRHKFAVPPAALGGQEPGTLSAVTAAVGEMTLTNAGEALVLRGKASATLSLECSRCLNAFEQPVETELEEEFNLIASNNAFHQDEVRAVDENTTAAVIDGSVLDLAELLRQSLLLAAPWQPICRDDCPGLGKVSTEDAPEATPETTRPFEGLGELWRARHPEEEGSEG